MTEHNHDDCVLCLQKRVTELLRENAKLRERLREEEPTDPIIVPHKGNGV